MSFSKLPLLSMLASRFFAISRRTWLLVSVALLILATLAIWAAISLAGWLFSVARESATAAPDVARNAVQQVEKVVPGATQAIEDLRMIGQASPPARDVSGTDPIPVARFPGLARTHWQREGQEIRVRYEGKADFATVLDHYAKGFADQGYRQELHAASPSEERHDYLKGSERVGVVFTKSKNSLVSVSITAPMP
jgi:hypothetical protein